MAEGEGVLVSRFSAFLFGFWRHSGDFTKQMNACNVLE